MTQTAPTAAAPATDFQRALPGLPRPHPLGPGPCTALPQALGPGVAQQHALSPSQAGCWERVEDSAPTPWEACHKSLAVSRLSGTDTGLTSSPGFLPVSRAREGGPGSCLVSWPLSSPNPAWTDLVRERVGDDDERRVWHPRWASHTRRVRGGAPGPARPTKTQDTGPGPGIPSPGHAGSSSKLLAAGKP